MLTSHPNAYDFLENNHIKEELLLSNPLRWQKDLLEKRDTLD